jgi:hypothetical protein
MYYSKPKTKNSVRIILIPQEVCDELKKHKKAQEKEKLSWGEDYQKDNLVFAMENREPIRPNNFYKMNLNKSLMLPIASDLKPFWMRRAVVFEVLYEGFFTRKFWREFQYPHR